MARRDAIVRALAWSATVGWASVIWYLSSLPSPPAPDEMPDVVGHALEYGLLAACLWAATADRRSKRPAGLRAAAIVGICALYGAIDELHQGFVPGRDPSLVDLAADIAGAAGAAAVIWALALRFRGGAPAGAPASPELTLVSRADCHLCDEAEDVIKRVREDTPFTYRKLDVDSDDSLKKRFGREVPVVLMEGRKIFKLRVDEERLRRRLRRAGEFERT